MGFSAMVSMLRRATPQEDQRQGAREPDQRTPQTLTSPNAAPSSFSSTAESDFCPSHNFVVPPLESPSERLGMLERALNLRLDSSLSRWPLDITENFWHRLGANATTLFEQYVFWLGCDTN